MSKHKFPKSVSFNLKNSVDQAILKHVKKRNFSGYVKKLILADMKKKNIDIKESSQTETPLSKMEELQRKLDLAKRVNNQPQNNSDS